MAVKTLQKLGIQALPRFVSSILHCQFGGFFQKLIMTVPSVLKELKTVTEFVHEALYVCFSTCIDFYLRFSFIELLIFILHGICLQICVIFTFSHYFLIHHDFLIYYLHIFFKVHVLVGFPF